VTALLRQPFSSYFSLSSPAGQCRYQEFTRKSSIGNKKIKEKGGEREREREREGERHARP
jgi:hypothetical protein